MRILFDSLDTAYLNPCTPQQVNTPIEIYLHIPAECGASSVSLQADSFSCGLIRIRREGEYDIFRGCLSVSDPGLYFYNFLITDRNGSYYLYRDKRGTNIGAGELWQMTVLPEEYNIPEDFRGAVYYQIFPDRFAKSGTCDLSEKLKPYSVRAFESFRPAAKDATDFAGGNLRGIIEKLDYIASLGTRVIYFNPIFMAHSNHRYDTADYTRVDPMLGTNEDFMELCRKVHEKNMRVVLDGVFSHTGSHSIYFDAKNVFGGGAVSEGPTSKYYKWYNFTRFPDKYDCWWGVDVLPCVTETEPTYLEFITGEHGIVRQWLQMGADGFRLDVADELPDSFIAALRRAVKAVKPDAVVIGEVWEDASNKISYHERRKYFSGGELDGVINYPMRKAILDFCGGRDDGAALRDTIETLAEHYPAAALDCTMAVLGTHDTERIGTMLPDPAARRGAVFLQFALPGSPVIYYGDEAGLTGGKDPQNRLPFPWGREDTSLTALYADCARLKNTHIALRAGSIRFLRADSGILRFLRIHPSETVECMLDRRTGKYTVTPIA